VLVRSAQIGTLGRPVLGGAATNRWLPDGPGRPGRAEDWRPGQAQGQAGQLDETGAPPPDGQGAALPLRAQRSNPRSLNAWITSRTVSSSAATSRAIAGTGVPVRTP
jgi:hypothetical protein